jgi:hypothetical protein
MIDWVDAAELQAAMREMADENPNKIYKKAFIDDGVPVCAYFDEDGCPSCLVGQGLSRLGLTMESVKGHNTDGTGDLIKAGIIVDADDALAEWLENAQSYQDTGFKWSEAIGAADNQEAENNREEEDDYDED